MSKLDDEIKKVAARIEQRSIPLSRMVVEGMAHCCAACFFGKEYTRLADKQARAKAWFHILLLKRGTPDDLKWIEDSKNGAWP